MIPKAFNIKDCSLRIPKASENKTQVVPYSSRTYMSYKISMCSGTMRTARWKLACCIGPTQLRCVAVLHVAMRGNACARIECYRQFCSLRLLYVTLSSRGRDVRCEGCDVGGMRVVVVVGVRTLLGGRGMGAGKRWCVRGGVYTAVGSRWMRPGKCGIQGNGRKSCVAEIPRIGNWRVRLWRIGGRNCSWF